MNEEVIVTCAVTGAGDTVGRHPAIPVTPEEIAAAAIEAARAGAAVAHIHVRDPATGKAARELALYREVVERIRASGIDVVINLTAGMGGDFVPDSTEPWRGGAGNRHGDGRGSAGACRGAAAGDLHPRLRLDELCRHRLCQHARHAARHGADHPRGRRAARDRGLRAGPCLAGEAAHRGRADRGPALVPALHGHPVRRRGRPAGRPCHARPAAGRLPLLRLRHRPDADADGGPGRACWAGTCGSGSRTISISGGACSPRTASWSSGPARSSGSSVPACWGRRRRGRSSACGGTE